MPHEPKKVNVKRLRQKALRVSAVHAGRDPVTGKIIHRKYNAVTAAEALKLAKRGATDKEIAVILNLRPGQVRQHYGAMIDRELALINLSVEEAIVANARGYSHPDTYINVYQGDVTKVPTTRHYPPNQGAANFWLRNRDPKAWRDSEGAGVADPDEIARLAREKLKAIDGVGG